MCSFWISQSCSSHSFPFLIPQGHRGAEYAKPYLSWGFHQHQELWVKVHPYFRAKTAICVPHPLQKPGKTRSSLHSKAWWEKSNVEGIFFHACLILNESKHSNCYLRKTSSTEGDFLWNSFDPLLEKRNHSKAGATLLLQSQEEQELLTEDFVLHFSRAQNFFVFVLRTDELIAERLEWVWEGGDGLEHNTRNQPAEIIWFSPCPCHHHYSWILILISKRIHT